MVHILFIWGLYVPAVDINKRCLDAQPHHECGTKQKASIDCVDEYGRLQY